MSLADVAQDNIDRRARANAPDQFTVDHARHQVEVWGRYVSALKLLATDAYEELGAPDVGLLSLTCPIHVHVAAIFETFGDGIDSQALKDAMAICEAAEVLE